MPEGFYKDFREIPDRTPFKGPLVEIEEIRDKERFQQLKGREDKIVRIVPMPERPTREHHSLEEQKRGQKLFQKLRDEYGIAIPHTNLVVVIDKENKKEGKVYAVIDRVYGDNLNKIESIPPESLLELDNFFESMLRHYYDVYKNGGDFFTDLNLRNLIYGHVRGESKNRVYIFDIDPWYHTYNKSRPMDTKIMGNYHMTSMLKNLVLLVTIIETKFGPLTQLTKTRVVMKQFLENLRPDDKNLADYLGLKRAT